MESKKRSFMKSGRTKAVTSGHSSSNSIYMDLNQFDDASDISVDDMQFMYSEMGDPDDSFNREGLFIDDNQKAEKTAQYQKYIKSKLNLDLFKIPILYLKWFLDSNFTGNIQINQETRTIVDQEKTFHLLEFCEQKYQLMKGYSYPLLGMSKDPTDKSFPVLSDATLKKIKQAGLFDSSKYEIYNLYGFIECLVKNLQSCDMNLKYEEF